MVGSSSETKKHYKPLILMAKDIETVSEMTSKPQDKVVILYETFKENFPKGYLFKRQCSTIKGKISKINVSFQWFYQIFSSFIHDISIQWPGVQVSLEIEIQHKSIIVFQTPWCWL